MMSSSGNNQPDLIGGDFPLTPDDLLKPEQGFTLPLPRKRYRLFTDTGRSAIYLALLAILREGGQRQAWLPRYSCFSVQLPFQLLEFKLHFYTMGNDLQSPEGLPDTLDGETILFIHYFGKKNLAVCRHLAEMRKKYRFFVIEDCVQALLTGGLGKGDFTVYSFRKFFPQPDGALLLSDYPLDGSRLLPPDEGFISRKLIGKLIKKSDDLKALRLLERGEGLIDRFTAPREMSFLSHYLLARTDWREVASCRRRNWCYLQQVLASMAGGRLRPLFMELDPDEVPLGFPVLVEPGLRNKLRSFLAEQRIYCPIHWPLTSIDDDLWPQDTRLSRSELTLPLDQRLDPSLIKDYLAAQLSRYFAGL